MQDIFTLKKEKFVEPNAIFLDFFEFFILFFTILTFMFMIKVLSLIEKAFFI